MKKLIIIFTILISFFIFDISFKLVSRLEYFQQKNFEISDAYLGGEKELTIAFYFNDQNANLFFNELYNFAKKEASVTYTVLFQDLSRFNSQVDYYILTKDKEMLRSFFTIEENKTIDFSKKNKAYYTSDLEDHNSEYHLAFLNDYYNKTFNDVINFHQFDALRNNHKLENKNFLFVHFYPKNEETFLTSLETSLLSDYQKESEGYNLYDETVGKNAEDETSLSQLLIIVASLTILLLMVGEVIHKKKEITLRKMFGCTSLYILKRLYLKNFIIIISIYLIVQALCYGIYIGNLYSNGVNFIDVLFKIFLFFILILMVIALVLYIIIVQIKNINIMKRAKNSSKLIGFNLILKTVIIVLLLQPTITLTQSAIENTKLYFILKNNKNEIIHNIYREGINVDGDNEGAAFFEKKQLVLDYFNNHGGYFQNFDTYYFSKIPGMGIEDIYPYPYLEANLNYLSKYPLRDEQGKKINVQSLKQDTLLVPLKYKNKDISVYEGNSIIYIQNGITFARNCIPPSVDSFYTKNPIIKVYTSIPLNHMMSDSYTAVMLPISNKSELKSLQTFQTKILQDKVSFKSNENDFKITINYISDKMVQSWIIIIIQVVTILIFLFETVYMYLLQEKQLYSLRYMFGGSFLERYGDLLLANLSVYVIVLLIGILFMELSVLSIVLSVLLMLLFESIITAFLIYRFEKRNIVKCLKGE